MVVRTFKCFISSGCASFRHSNSVLHVLLFWSVFANLCYGLLLACIKQTVPSRVSGSSSSNPDNPGLWIEWHFLKFLTCLDSCVPRQSSPRQNPGLQACGREREKPARSPRTFTKAAVTMAVPTDSPPGPVFRSEANEMEDFHQAVQSAVNAAYLDWPNEAGVRRISKQALCTLPEPFDHLLISATSLRTSSSTVVRPAFEFAAQFHPGCRGLCIVPAQASTRSKTSLVRPTAPFAFHIGSTDWLTHTALISCPTQTTPAGRRCSIHPDDSAMTGSSMSTTMDSAT